MVEAAFDVPHESLGFHPGGLVVGQLDTAIILMGARTLDVEKISRHLKAANAPGATLFLKRLAVEVVGVEVTGPLQSFEIVKGHRPVFPREQAAFPQLLKRPVDMDDRAASRIGEILLRQGKMKTPVCDETHGGQATRDFADEVGDAG